MFLHRIRWMCKNKSKVRTSKNLYLPTKIHCGKKKSRVPCLCRVFFPSTCPSSRENLEENSAFDRTKALLKIPTKMILREMRCLSWICRPAMHRYLHRYHCMDLRNGKICYTTIIHTNFPSLTAKQLLKTSKNY